MSGGHPAKCIGSEKKIRQQRHARARCYGGPAPAPRHGQRFFPNNTGVRKGSSEAFQGPRMVRSVPPARRASTRTPRGAWGATPIGSKAAPRRTCPGTFAMCIRPSASAQKKNSAAATRACRSSPHSAPRSLLTLQRAAPERQKCNCKYPTRGERRKALKIFLSFLTPVSSYRAPLPGDSRVELRCWGGTNPCDVGLDLSGSWQQGHSATYNAPSRI